MSVEKEKSLSTMPPGRLAEIVDAYGGQSQHWPAAEREAAERLVQDNSQRKHLQESAANFDSLLDAMQPVAPPTLLHARILADFERNELLRRRKIATRLSSGLKNLVDTFWPGAPLWQPACAFILSLVLGIAVGAMIHPESTSPDAMEYSASSVLDAPPSVDPGQAV
jgi:hypothetical protein